MNTMTALADRVFRDCGFFAGYRIFFHLQHLPDRCRHDGFNPAKHGYLVADYCARFDHAYLFFRIQRTHYGIANDFAN